MESIAWELAGMVCGAQPVIWILFAVFLTESLLFWFLYLRARTQGHSDDSRKMAQLRTGMLPYLFLPVAAGGLALAYPVEAGCSFGSLPPLMMLFVLSLAMVLGSLTMLLYFLQRNINRSQEKRGS